MTTGEPATDPFDRDEEPEIIANFIDPDGEVVARWSATNLPIPSAGDTVSFGELHAPDIDSLDGDEAEYSLGDTLYDVIEVEYNYSEVTTDAEADPPHSEFVMVSIYIAQADSQ